MDSINNTNNTNSMNSSSSSSSISMTECVTSKPSCKRAGERSSPLYKAAARNLREYHGVPSLTPGGLEKTMVLLELRPARLVAQGLAPKALLKGNSTAGADADSTDSSSESEVEPEQANNKVSDDLTSNSSDSGDTENDNIATQDSTGFEPGASKHPIQAVFLSAGVKLRPRETRPLLRALGVGPHRLVKLGLVQREELRRFRPGGRRDGPPHQQHGRPGGRGHHHRGGGMGRPRGPPPHGPPPHRHGHSSGRRPAHRDPRRLSSPIHGPPPPGQFEETDGEYHGPRHHHHGGESEGEEEMAMYAGLRGSPHGLHPPPHLRGQCDLRRRVMSMPDRHMHLPPHGPGHHHHAESEGEEELAMMHAGLHGPAHGLHTHPHLRGQRGPRRHGDRHMHPFHHGPGLHHHGGESEGEEEMVMMHAGLHCPPHGLHLPPHLRGQRGPRRHGDRHMHPFHHGPGLHHHGGESEGEEEMVMMHAGLHGPPHGLHPPPHLRGQRGPRRHGMSMHDHQRHPYNGLRHHQYHGEVWSEGEHGAGIRRGPGRRAHPRQHPEHHGMHHLGRAGAHGMGMDLGPLPHGGRHHHRGPVGLRHRVPGPPPGPPCMRFGMPPREEFSDAVNARQQQRQRQKHQARMKAGPAHFHSCHERPRLPPMMLMQAY